MAFVTDVHFLVAFLVGLCALVFSWNTLGRRVMNVVLGLQVLIGLVVAGMHFATHEKLEPQAGPHIALAFLGALFYGIAAGAGRRGRSGPALILSILGLLTVFATIYYGFQMYLHH